ncbi:MAG: hypothetical protein HQL05_04310 [Nitrospirae bacterium]|uniref:hypothetical protein n=1 Tax=Candidatus Magnetobacterium casense TaxID=1455061 RepID=UPI00058E6F04|nr:hypothetical protein [Candidatus Magnetobacterium casensis]MBF0337034.1 hypothetical protein [Nitrospirota bacterium]
MEMCQKDNTTDDVVFSHTIEVFASEDSRYPIQDEFEIPRGYDLNEVVVLPVNKGTVFVYWEITEGFLSQWREQLRRQLSDLSGADLILAAFELSSGRVRHITTFALPTLSGKRYISYQGNFNPTVAIVGAVKGGVFYDMLISRTIYYPPYRLEGIDEIINELRHRYGRSGAKPPDSDNQVAEPWEYTFSGSSVERRS